jgi:SRSO17 transposase
MSTSPKKGVLDFRELSRRFTDFAKVYTSFFDVFSDNVSAQARCYLSGLLMKSPRKNMERMEEYVDDCDYQKIQQFLTDSPWSDKKLQNKIGQDTNAELGCSDAVLAIDDSGFTKKGKKSVGVARQWNGRLGKTDNCQVGVFAALINGRLGNLIDKRLYLPQEWTNDPTRCEDAGIPPERQVFKKKPELALEMIDSAIENRITFGAVVGDGFYGNTPQFARDLDARRLQFMLDIHMDQTVYLADPKPYLPRRKNGCGPKFKTLRSRADGVTTKSVIANIDSSEYEKIEVRETSKGTLNLLVWRKQVWLWDGEEKQAKQWWLVVTKNCKDNEIKAFLSNAQESISLKRLVVIHQQRFWIERCFQDAKTSLGMADYQARKWNSWNHHICMVTLGMLFMLKERIHHEDEVMLLSCQDIVELLNFYLPRADLTEDAVLHNMERRHKKRLDSIKSAYCKQGKIADCYFEKSLTK